jgi:mannosyltransferase OCH1-like enzyme
VIYIFTLAQRINQTWQQNKYPELLLDYKRRKSSMIVKYKVLQISDGAHKQILNINDFQNGKILTQTS